MVHQWSIGIPIIVPFEMVHENGPQFRHIHDQFTISEKKKSKIHLYSIEKVLFYGNKIYTCSYDGTIKIFEVQNSNLMIPKKKRSKSVEDSMKIREKVNSELSLFKKKLESEEMKKRKKLLLLNQKLEKQNDRLRRHGRRIKEKLEKTENDFEGMKKEFVKQKTVIDQLKNEITGLRRLNQKSKISDSSESFLSFNHLFSLSFNTRIGLQKIDQKYEKETKSLQKVFLICSKIDEMCSSLSTSYSVICECFNEWNVFKGKVFDLSSSCDFNVKMIKPITKKLQKSFECIKVIKMKRKQVQKYYDVVFLKKKEDMKEEETEGEEEDDLVFPILREKDDPLFSKAESFIKKFLNLTRRIDSLEKRREFVIKKETKILQKVLQFRVKTEKEKKEWNEKKKEVTDLLSKVEKSMDPFSDQIYQKTKYFCSRIGELKKIKEEVIKFHEECDSCIDVKNVLRKKCLSQNIKKLEEIAQKHRMLEPKIMRTIHLFDPHRRPLKKKEEEEFLSLIEKVPSVVKQILKFLTKKKKELESFIGRIDQYQMDTKQSFIRSCVPRATRKTIDFDSQTLKKKMDYVSSKVVKMKLLHQSFSVLKKKYDETKAEIVMIYTQKKEEIKNSLSVLQFQSQIYEMEKKERKLRRNVRKVKRKIEDLEDEDSEDEESEGEDDDNNEEKLQKLKKELKEMSKDSNTLKREKEKLERSIYLMGRKTLKFIRDGIVLDDEGKGTTKFVKFLKKNGVYVEREIEKDYEPLKLIQSNQGDVFLTKLKFDYFEEPKIIKLLPNSPYNEICVMKEVKSLLKLKGHPSIIDVNCVFVDKKNKIGIEMEYYQTDLLRWLKNFKFSDDKDHSRISPDELIKFYQSQKTVRSKKSIVRVFRQILEGICHIHASGIQHSDLKPQNIIMNNEFEVKIIDFGVAKDDSLSITRTNMGMTIRYAPPEAKKNQGGNVVKKRESLGRDGNEAWDMYSFGLMLLEALSPPEIVEEIPRLVEKGGRKDVWKKKFGIQNVEEVELFRSLLNTDPKKRKKARDVLMSGVFRPEAMIALINEKEFDVKKMIRDGNMENIRKKLDVLYRPRESVIKVEVDRRFVDEDDDEVGGKEYRRRKDIVVSALNQLVRSTNRIPDLVARIAPKFTGEGAYGQGVTRELFYTLFEQLRDDSFGYCDRIGEHEEFGCSFLPTDRMDHSEVFFMLGKLAFRCLLEKRHFQLPFSPLLFAYILSQEPKDEKEWIRYCKLSSPDFLQNLENNTSTQSIFEMLKDQGVTFEDENGDEIPLSGSNKRSYLYASVLFKMKGNINRMKNILSFRKGFMSLIPSDLSLEMRHLLNPFELDFMCHGPRNVDLTLERFMNNLVFGGGNVQIMKRHFERYFGGEENVGKRWEFFRYATSTKDVNSDGVLFIDGSPKKIKIRFHQERNDYIMSHSCFGTVDVAKNLYEEDKYEDFKKVLDYALGKYKEAGMFE